MVLAGCKKERKKQKSLPVAAPTAVIRKDIVEVKETKKAPKFIYTSEGKRDPFKTFIKKAKVKKVKSTIPLTPLQEYDITQLRLTGIISGLNENKAMVTDPAGKGYILKKGTLIGKNFGRVEKISKNEVVVIEDVQDFLGNIITKEIPLILDIGEEKK